LRISGISLEIPNPENPNPKETPNSKRVSKLSFENWDLEIARAAAAEEALAC
jgi:hypothetical protein